MSIVSDIQGLVLLLLGLGALLLTAFAFFDVLRRSGPLFPHVGKLTKPVWLGILAVAFLISIVSFGGLGTLGFLNVIGVVAAGVYLADLRPKLIAAGGGRGGGSQHGPYGPY